MGVSEGIIGASVKVSDGISVTVEIGVMGVITITLDVGIITGKVGGRRMSGVAVTIPGVREGIGVQTGNG